MLYASYWVIPRLLNFKCQRFGTLCLHRQVSMKNFFIPTCLWRWKRRCFPKLWHVIFRRQGINQKKACLKCCCTPSLHQLDVIVLVLGFDVITSIVSFLWAYTTAARDVTGERVRTAYDVTAACYHKRCMQRNVFCHTWY